MAGVQRGQQMHHFGPAHLAHDQPVGPHPQCLPHEVLQRDESGALLVGGSGLEADDMRMVRPQLRRVLGEHDPLAASDQPQQRAQQRRLAAARPAADEKRQPRVQQRAQHAVPARRHRARRNQFVEGERPGPYDAQRQTCAGHGHGGSTA